MMMTSLRSIGNSRGVLLPAAFLASCNMRDRIEMQLVGSEIILRSAPVVKTPRQGWFDSITPDTEQLDASKAEALEWDQIDDSFAKKRKNKEAAADEWVW